jgi:hypothetical protein
MDTSTWPYRVGNLLISCAILLGFALLLAFASGWMSLSEHYGRGGRLEGERVWFASGRMSWLLLPCRFRNSLSVVVADAGISLSLLCAIPILFAPLLIPWDEMADCRRWTSLWGSERFRFRPLRGRVEITLHGRAAARVRSALASHQLSRVPPDARVLAGQASLPLDPA